ncbi:MAG: hypothetical protein Q4E62_06280, partial [Sutterellaceae bacterium]|nr:hypothetical protein [Sutterellaceae bacterium]
MNNPFKLNAVTVAVLAAAGLVLVGGGQRAHAAEPEKQPVNAQNIENDTGASEEVVVQDTRDKKLTSMQHLSREDIAKRPTDDGNITDLLKTNVSSPFTKKIFSSAIFGRK